MADTSVVSTSVMIAVCVTLFLTLFLPLILYVAYGARNKGKGVWTAWLLGAAGFFVFQIVIRIPLLNLLSLNQGFQTFAAKHYVLYCLVLAFTAGLFETAGRYLVARVMAKQLTFQKGFAAGMGHGGIEAMLIVGMTYVNNLIYILMINSGTFDQLVRQTEQLGVDASSLYMAKNVLISADPVMFYLAGYERILTMIFHVALSLMICYFVWNKKAVQGILICLLLHTVMDFIAPLINGMTTEYLGSILSTTAAYILVYVFLTGVAVLSVAGIILIRNSWKRKESA